MSNQIFKMAVNKVHRVGSREKMMKIVKKGDEKVYLVAQELKLARVLAGNNKHARDKALKNLKAWFAKRTETMPFTEDDFQRIWKGLFYSMWMSDKPLIQEECAENISKLVHFPTLDSSLLFFKAGLTVLMNEWFGIDQLRLDKFLMLVRRLLRQTLFVLKTNSFIKENITHFNNVLSETILSTEGSIRPTLGLFMHFTEIFMEELAKVTEGNINSDCVVHMLRPFLKKMTSTNDRRQIGHIRKFIFTYLIRQSDCGLEYQAKYDAWKQQGFPGSIDSIQKIKLDTVEQMSSDEEGEENIENKPLDPRAGRVNVELPQIKFKAKNLAAVILEYKFAESSTAVSRKMITTLADQFTKLSKGIYPLGIRKVENKSKDNYDANIRKAANRLIKFEQKLMGKNRKRKPEKENGEIPVVERKRQKIENKDVTAKLEDEKKHKKVLIENNKNKTKSKNRSLSKPDTTSSNENGENNVDNVSPSQYQYKNIARPITSDHSKKNKKKLDKNNCKQESKTKKNKSIVNNIECVFERNSGTWVVYDISTANKNEKVPSANTEVDHVVVQEAGNPSKYSEKISKISKRCNNSEQFEITRVSDIGLEETKINIDKELSSPKKMSLYKSASPNQNKLYSLLEKGSPKSGLSPVKLFEPSPDQKQLFPKSEWDEPLQEGEYEICIPSKKYVGKLKKIAKKNDESVQTIINNAMKKIKGKSRLSSLSSNLISNPFSTPSSTKKVKINTKLNRSQEVHEHHAQILSSPGIPYDANKKPSKPLLKTPLKSTPINPFYSKQLSFL